ncbi:hypothetical protein [uncultured Microscilla sp.]|uniref:hypothetical protein n=1 Tax=uncultured Microscilla sp. TaxID=432653 RepID=UPI0026165EB7|nr:hypothetical protein [uncultured Microscilla sp.]
MKKQWIVLVCLLAIVGVGCIPATSLWKILMKVTWVKKYDHKTKANTYVPKFTKEIQALNGKQITIKGYLIPVDLYGDGDFAIISALPVASCFFCGGAGPETVMEVYTKQKIKADKSGKVTFRGRLELNPDNADHLIYILRDAKVM